MAGALAREAGVEDAVTEATSRLDYLDALAVQTRADVLLLLGSSEPMGARPPKA